MSKKSKKTRWFNRGWGGKETELDEKDQSLFSNTIQKHSQKLKEKGLLDEHGFEILPEDDYSYSSYNWDWDKKLLAAPEAKDKKERYEITKSEYSSQYSTYEKTGYWGGYYKQPQLTYKYVQQMAHALSASHNIKVQVGNDWNVDLLHKTLTYNPASLIYGTKGELLATLMHEIGKLRYVTHSSLLGNKYITMYQQPAKEVLSVYEDLRTDYLMLRAYEGASEIYESVIPTVEKQVDGYMKYGDTFRKVVAQIPQNVFQQIISDHTSSTSDHYVHPEDPVLKEKLLKTFGTSDLDKVKAGLKEIEKNLSETGTIYEYCGEMLSTMYDLDEQGHKKFENIKEKIEKTIDTIEPSKKFDESKDLVNYLDQTTYPIVEDLLKDAKDKNDAIQKAFPKMPEPAMRQMMQMVQQMMGKSSSLAQLLGNDPSGNMKPRSSGQTNITVPPEWESGDYKTLKDSVGMEIKQLINRLTFLRREELTVRYEANQKRGKLNSKTLYKASRGSKRLFKKKLENTDTIRSFAFSVLLDVSGSMSGARITHCTRALIILAEVFKKMQIPFELVTFSDGATVIKPFAKEIDKTMEKKIGGLVKYSGGGTNLNEGLDALKLKDQPEKNKIVIVLTDGGVGDMQWYDDTYFIPWAKKGIKSVGFGIECESAMKDLCMGNSRLLDNASALPVEFSNLLKSLIKRK